MSITVKCPGCEKKLKAKGELAGKEVNCPSCGHPVVVSSGANASVNQRNGANAPRGDVPIAASDRQWLLPMVGGAVACGVLVLSLAGWYVFSPAQRSETSSPSVQGKPLPDALASDATPGSATPNGAANGDRQTLKTQSPKQGSAELPVETSQTPAPESVEGSPSAARTDTKQTAPTKGAAQPAKEGVNTAVEKLMSEMNSNSANDRSVAATTLGKLGSDAKPAVPTLMEALKTDKSLMVRRAAAKAIGMIGPEARSSASSLILTLKDEDNELRRAAATALGSIGADPQLAVPGLLALLKEQVDSRSIANSQILEAASESLAKFGVDAKLAIDEIIPLLRHLDARARQAAVRVLGSIGEPAVRPLILAMRDENFIRRSYPVVLKERTVWPSQIKSRRGLVLPPNVGGIPPDLNRRQTLERIDRFRSLPSTALGEALAMIGAPAVQSTIAVLNAEDVDVRAAAAWTLGRIGQPALEALIASLEDDTPQVRQFAALALGSMGPGAKQALPHLERMLKDREASVRAAASEALADIGPDATTSVRPLTAALSDRDPAVRGGAALALGQIGSNAKSAVPALKRLVRDRHDQVKAIVATALRQIDPVEALASLPQNPRSKWRIVKVFEREERKNAFGKEFQRRKVGFGRGGSRPAGRENDPSVSSKGKSAASLAFELEFESPGDIIEGPPDPDRRLQTIVLKGNQSSRFRLVTRSGRTVSECQHYTFLTTDPDNQRRVLIFPWPMEPGEESRPIPKGRMSQFYLLDSAGSYAAARPRSKSTAGTIQPKETPSRSKGSGEVKDGRQENQENLESKAANKLELAKQLLEKDASSAVGKEWLREVADEYPNTPAAQKAKKLLKQL